MFAFSYLPFIVLASDHSIWAACPFVLLEKTSLFFFFFFFLENDYFFGFESSASNFLLLLGEAIYPNFLILGRPNCHGHDKG